MRTLARTLAGYAALAMVLGGCTTGDTFGPLNGSDIDKDAIGVDNGKSDLPTADTEQDEGPADIVVEPGGHGWPCTANNECNSGYCVATPNGKQCAKLCVDSCPPFTVCRPLTSGDPNYLCLPQFLHLCDPCTQATDCAASSDDVGHYCLDLGAKGKFCGGNCEQTGECPPGYKCQTVPVGGGQTKAQCVPTSGQCECSQLAIDFQLATTCANSNEFGSCGGIRMCTAAGLNDCDAKMPAAELCDGLDNNCDGATDNLGADYQCFKTNEHGSCPGQGTCIGGNEICDAPNPAPETCDGIDNDCNGTTDDGFLDTDGDTKKDCLDEDDDDDGVPDVSDNCDLTVNPDQANNDGDDMGDACDPDDDNDGSPDDQDCAPLDGNVAPGAVEKCDGIDNDCNGATDDNLCDDGNPCTQGSCNADGSCAQQPLNGTSCEDSEGLCTTNDVCLNGECVGNPVNCDDGNPCTEDLCNPGTGSCSNLGPPKNGEPCSDNSTCTANDTCQNGICLGTYDVEAACSTDGNPCKQPIGCSPPSQCTYQYNTGVSCSTYYQQTKGSIPQCHKAVCQATGECELVDSNNGQACNTGSGDCPQGTCSGGNCQVKSGQPCDYDPDFCEADTPGTCTGAGECIPLAQSGCSCSGCAGICVCCNIGPFPLSVCIPF